ncbi:MAG TPA: hypothetical protein VHA06_05055, partial [Candidatus Angelobacter sp.]|nr:hypothetical protein [Candidatus Angelobacter sp.]
MPKATSANIWFRILLFLSIFIVSVALQAQDNGIHVAVPKVYDTRSLQLMMDDLAKSLQKPGFIDPKALAATLGNVQGYNATDFSQGLSLSGAVGPQAASVFAGNGGVPASPASSSSPSTPAVSISIAPTLNAGTSSPAPSTGSGSGPQPPALPAFQTGPTYNPTFGPSGG